jgi:tubulin alpha
VVLHHVVKLADSTLAFKVFSSFIAFGSGTDFGFTSLLVGKVPVDYGKKGKLEPTMYPAPQMSCAVVEP